MYTDLETTFLNNVAVRAAATLDTLAEDINVIDLSLVGGRIIGTGAIVLPIMLLVTEAFDAGGTNVTIALSQSAAVTMTSPTVLVTTGAIAYAAGTLGTLGYRFPQIQFIPRHTATLRYLAMTVVSTGTFTTGRLTSFIPMDEQSARTGFTAVTGIAAA